MMIVIIPIYSVAHYIEPSQLARALVAVGRDQLYGAQRDIAHCQLKSQTHSHVSAISLAEGC